MNKVNIQSLLIIGYFFTLPLCYADQLSSRTQHGGDCADAASEPGLTGRAQSGPTRPHESIQGKRGNMFVISRCDVDAFTCFN